MSLILVRVTPYLTTKKPVLITGLKIFPRENYFWNQFFEGLSKAESPKTALNSDFPKADHADEFGVFLSFDELSGLWAEFEVSVYKPKEGVAIKQQVHFV